MTPTKYIEAAYRTINDKFYKPVNRDGEDLLHAAIGIATESGELLDAIKKQLFYGKSLDRTNIKEEVGDLLWYIALLCHSQGWSFEEIMLLNIEKLKARYPDKFEENKAIHRNLPLERLILEVGKEVKK